MTPEEQAQQIRLTWQTFFDEGDVVELRSFKNGAAKTVSGYFDNHASAIKAVEGWEREAKRIGIAAQSWFFALNPVNPALIARRDNHVGRNVDDTTKDEDILRRKHLLIDSDPVRPSGISATDDEKAAAVERMDAVRSWLLSEFGIQTTKADSSNGAHAHMRIDLANDEDSKKLCEDILTVLGARFSDDIVKIDGTNFNAARVCKLYGTLGRKGDSTPDRPHRYARLIEVPDDWQPVPVETLERLVALLPAPDPTGSPVTIGLRGKSSFSVESFLADHGVAVKHKIPYKDGCKYQIDCPFDSSHAAPDAVVYEYSNGKAGFKCSHDSCKDKHWQDFRLLHDPAAYDNRNVFEKMQRAHGTVTQTVDSEGDEPKSVENGHCPYEERPYGIVRFKKGPEGGTEEIPITNFLARIVATVTIDDGAESSLSFEIEGFRAGRRYAFPVPAKDFSALSWVIEKMGPQTVVYAGLSAKDHTRVAIQMLSGTPEERFQYRHTGWRNISGQWVYLHAGGWVGGELSGAVSVALEGGLAEYRLPEPTTDALSREAVRASLQLLEIAKPEIIFPLFAALWRSAIDAADFSIHVAGATQSGKSTLAALLQQHFGPSMNSRALPGAWSSTDNALEDMAFKAKDALLTVDDYVPKGTISDVQRLQAKAERVLRAQGNNSGRMRMRADGTLRAVRPPRGLILSTGEDVPPGESLRARMLIVELGRGDLDTEILHKCQADADTGVYAQAMTAFLSWLAPQYEKRRKEMHDAALRLRDKWGNGELLRTPDILANLAAGFQVFLAFCMDSGTLTEKEVQQVYKSAVAALKESGNLQARHQAASEPAKRFVELLQQAVSSGKAHLTDDSDSRPENALAYGWRKEPDAHGDYNWRPLGDRIGWVTERGEYLLPEASYNVAKRMGDSGGEGISIAPKTLAKRLREKNMLETIDATRNTATVRKVIGGQRRDLLHFAVGTLLSTRTDQTDQLNHDEEI